MSTALLLTIAVASVLILLLLVIKIKIHPFVALLVVSLMVAMAYSDRLCPGSSRAG